MATKKDKMPMHKMPNGTMMKGKDMKKEMPMKGKMPMKKGKC